jgi:hypothetical protein
VSDVISIKAHRFGAGSWIYLGFARAWDSLGFDVRFFDDINDVDDRSKFIMTTESDLIEGFNKISSADKSFVFVQPTTFPDPWGRHPNWVSAVDHQTIEAVRRIPSIKPWTFVNNTQDESYQSWGNVNYLPLAFDSLGYKITDQTLDYNFDVCFVGGWADNGFNEKRKRIIEFLEKLQDSGLKCGFFVNSGITHEQENFILNTSRVAINIHDEYQVRLGLDVNERTFKSLALTGLMTSDNVKEMKHLFPEVKLSNSPDQMLESVREYLSLNDQDIELIKSRNRSMIINEHTYISRVKEMISL